MGSDPTAKNIPTDHKKCADTLLAAFLDFNDSKYAQRVVVGANRQVNTN